MPDRLDRPPRRAIDGVIIVAKEPGPTSHDVVALVRRLTGARRVGHGGTLDPFAAGVLPVFLGHATRLVEYHVGDAKEYRALIALGVRSTTDDIDGELTPTDSPAPTRAQVEDALEGFRGEIQQVPPDYSAVRVAGRHAYELARHGRKPELRARTVTISRLELMEWDEATEGRPTATVEMHCSAGTYVRALARDLGEVLGCGAYLAALTRLASGSFRIADAHSLDEVRKALTDGPIGRVLLPPTTGLEHLPRVEIGSPELRALAKGQPIRTTDGVPADGPLLLVDGRGSLVAVARHERGQLQPEKVFLEPLPEA